MVGTLTTTIEVGVPLIVVGIVTVPLRLPDVIVVVCGGTTDISTTTILVDVPLTVVATVLVVPEVGGPKVVV